MKLITHPVVRYIETGQTKEIQLAFCNKVEEGVKMLTYWMNCRDLFTDILFLEEIKKEYGTYGFNYNPSIDKIDRDKLRIVIKINFEEDAKNIEENVSILHDIEESNGLEKTVFTKIKKKHYLYEGDAFWLNTSFSLNIYTFLIKIMGYSFKDKNNWIEEMKEREGVEAGYVKRFIPQFKDVLYSSLKAIFSSPTTTYGHTDTNYAHTDYCYFIHDHGGVLSFFGKDAINYTYMKTNTYFKRMQEILNGKA